MVFAATTDQVPNREIHGVTYTFVTVTDARFFEFEPVVIDARTVNITTVEKILIDCADHPEHCGGISELARGLVNATDLGRGR